MSYEEYINLFNQIKNTNPKLAAQFNNEMKMNSDKENVFNKYKSMYSMSNYDPNVNVSREPINQNNISNNQNNISNNQMVNGSNVIDTGLAALGVASNINPVLSAGLMGLKGLYDYNKNIKAHEDAIEQARQIENMRSLANSKYMNELDNNFARKENLYRGQFSQSPLYSAAIDKAADAFRYNNSANTDMLEKMGLGDKSGMAAQLQTQNFDNLTKNIGQAVQNSMPRNNAYGGLQQLSTTTRPEMLNYDFDTKLYNDSKDYMDYYAPAMNLLGEYGQNIKRDYDYKKGLQTLNNNKGY